MGIFDEYDKRKRKREKEKLRVEIVVDEVPLYPSSDSWTQYRSKIISFHDGEKTDMEWEYFGSTQEHVFMEASKHLNDYFHVARSSGKL